MAEITRLNVNLNEATAKALKELAEVNGLTLTETVRRAISVYKFMDDEVKSGNKIRVKEPNGDVREIVGL